MSKLKRILAKPIAKYFSAKVDDLKSKPIEAQKTNFKTLLDIGKKTQFGLEHYLRDIHTYEEYCEAIPLRVYENFSPYIDLIQDGKKDVLWKGAPLYFAMTSGTVSGTKYIPVSKEAIPYFANTGRLAFLRYMHKMRDMRLIEGKGIFIQGSPKLEKKGAIPIGKMSGITYHHIPSFFRHMLMPSYSTNTIKNWEEKIDKIADETIRHNMTIIGGIPPWVMTYFEKVLEKTGKTTIKEVFPHFQLHVFGGLSFAPYRSVFEQLIGGKVGEIETYAASEGFIAFQDSQEEEGMLLNVNAGMFFEFIPLNEIHKENPKSLSLEEVKIDTVYAIILTTNSGLWRYNIGDTVRFVSLKPYRLVVSGRIEHYINTYGEHIIAEEVEATICQAVEEAQIEIVEFTVAPAKIGEKGMAHHEWFIEFIHPPADLPNFEKRLDKLMFEQNLGYRELRKAGILQTLKIVSMPSNSFRAYMKSKNKLGGQNKLARLSNDREIAEALAPFITSSKP